MENNFRNACQYSYTTLWSLLLLLGIPEEALRVVEEGGAQALMDLMKLQYGSKSPASEASKKGIEESKKKNG